MKRVFLALLVLGALLPAGQILSIDAVKDLTAWAAEKGILAVRAARTLGVHYGRILNEQPDPELREELQRYLADCHAPAPLRIELANLLNQTHFLERDLQEHLLDPVNPAPLRLIAAEALLEFGDHPGAIAALRQTIAQEHEAHGCSQTRPPQIPRQRRS